MLMLAERDEEIAVRHAWKMFRKITSELYAEEREASDWIDLGGEAG
jgi:hypothetical protein